MAREKNLCKKERKIDNPYEICKTPDGSSEWRVLSKNQSPTNEAKNPYATWFVACKSPMTYDRFEYGSEYAHPIMKQAIKVS